MNIKPEPVYVASVLIPFSVVLMWFKNRWVRQPGVIIFSIVVFIFGFMGLNSLLYDIFPSETTKYPVMAIITWREIISAVLILVLVLIFILTIRKNHNKGFLITLGAGCLLFIWLGFIFA